MPIVYYFSSSNPKITNSQISNHLKKSLSETLSTYYPLAGRLTGRLYVDCNVGGVPFSEIEANCNLSQIIHDPNLKFMTKLLPYDIMESQAEAGLCMAVQVTYFRCGGFTLGLLLAHKIVDALSGALFVNSWASIARIGDLGSVPIPKFDIASYFPPQDIPEINLNMERMKKDVIATTLTFPAEKISLIREMYSDDGKQRPSRVEALTTYIWTQFLSATTTTQSDPNEIYKFTQPLNLRSLIDELPPSQYHFGNVYGTSMAKPTAGDSGIEIWKKIRQANKSVYENYMGMMKDTIEKHTNSFTIGETIPLSRMC